MIKKIILATCLGITPLFSLSVTNIATDMVSDAVNDYTSSFGLPVFDVKCETGMDNIDLYRICGILDKIDIDLGLDFEIGGCTIKTADPLSCQKDALRDFCRNSVRNINGRIGAYQASITNSISSTSEELLGSGGTIVGDFMNCNYIDELFTSKKTNSGRTLSEIYDDSSLKSVKKFGIFSTASKEVQDCLKDEKDESKCFNVDDWTLPDTLVDSEKDVSFMATQSNSTTTSYIKGAIETESQLSQEIYSKCKNLPEPTACINSIINQKDGHVKKRDAAIANIETSSAIKTKMLSKASSSKEEFVYRGTEIVKVLPMEFRTDYMDGAARANAVDIVTENLYYQNTQLEKESIVILDNKIIDSSQPYIESNGYNKIQSLMEQ